MRFLNIFSNFCTKNSNLTHCAFRIRTRNSSMPKILTSPNQNYFSKTSAKKNFNVHPHTHPFQLHHRIQHQKVYNQLLEQHEEPFKSITKSVTDVSLAIIEGFRDIIKALSQKTEISMPGRQKDLLPSASQLQQWPCPLSTWSESPS